MEEAIVDGTLDLNVPPATCALQAGVQEETRTETGDQAQFPTNVQNGCQAASQWPQNRAELVEILHQCVTSGVYCVDSAELAQYIWDNSTHFLERGFAIAETY